MASESFLQKKTMAILNHPASPCRVWRNNVGGYYDANGRYVEYGLAKGSADLIGLERILITPEMVGQTFARFLSVEMKAPKGKVSELQKIWQSLIQNLGGTALIVRDPAQAEEHIQKIRGTR